MSLENTPYIDNDNDNLSITPKRGRGRPPKDESSKDEGNRRLELINCAAKLFRINGFAATSTRDIASAANMHSGSPFYHFESKQALLFEVMQSGMHSAMNRQNQALKNLALGVKTPDATEQLRCLIRHHFEVLLGPGNDFIPVMLYEFRSLNAPEQALLSQLQRQYEAPWIPVLQALYDQKVLLCPVKIARLLIFGALNWAVQWYSVDQQASLDELTDAAILLFIHPSHRLLVK